MINHFRSSSGLIPWNCVSIQVHLAQPSPSSIVRISVPSPILYPVSVYFISDSPLRVNRISKTCFLRERKTETVACAREGEGKECQGFIGTHTNARSVIVSNSTIPPPPLASGRLAAPNDDRFKWLDLHSSYTDPESKTPQLLLKLPQSSILTNRYFLFTLHLALNPGIIA